MKKRWKRLVAGLLVMVVFITSSHMEVFATDNKSEEMQQMSEALDNMVDDVTEDVLTEETEESVCGESATYTLVDGVLTISGTGAVNSNAFQGNREIRSIIVGDGITDLGEGTFIDCTNVESITLGAGITELKYFVFRYCHALNEVTINSDIMTINGSAFSGVEGNVKTLHVGKNVTLLDSYFYLKFSQLDTIHVDEANETFCSIDGVLYNKEQTKIIRYPNCKEGTEYSIPETVEIIGENAFNNSDNLEQIIIPDSVIEIQAKAFRECDNITEVKFPESLVTIGNEAFFSCDKLTMVEIPDSVTELGEYAFCDCVNVKEIVLGTGISELRYFTFRYCHALNEVTINSDITKINGSAFSGVEGNVKTLNVGEKVTTLDSYFYHTFNGLKEINVDENNLSYSSEDGILFNKDKTSLIRYPHKKEAENYNIPTTVTEISNKAFYDIDTIQTVKFPESLVTIGKEAFFSCDKLTMVEIPDSVTELGEYAFCDCVNVKEIVLGTGISELKYFAFRYCHALNEVTINSDIMTINGSAFSGVEGNVKTLHVGKNVTLLDSYFYLKFSQLDTIHVDEANETFCSIDGVLYNKEQTKIIRYPNCKEGTEYSIPETVEIIGENAFNNSDNLEQIIIPDSVIEIQAKAFRECDNITEVKFPESLVTIGNEAFFSCDKLAKVEIPDSVTELGEYAFCDCVNVKEIVLGTGISELRYFTFRYCHALNEVTINSDITKINGSAFSGVEGNVKTLNVGEKVTTLDSYFCHTFNGLKEIIVDEKNSSYSTDQGVLYTKDKKTLIRYPDKKEDESYHIDLVTEKIEKEAFADNKNLKKVFVPDSVKEIGDGAFARCTGLEKIVIPTSVKKIGEYALVDCTNLKTVQIPTEVTEIGYQAFRGSGNVVIYCEYGSYAAQYAKDNGIEYVTSSNCVTFTLYKQYAVNQGENDNRLSESVKNYNVTIANNTTGETISGYQINYGSIVLNADSVTGGDELTIRLEHKKNETVPLEKTFRLNEYGNAIIELESIQKGFVTATVRTKINGCMMLYDAQGNRIEVKEIKNGSYRSSYLEEGDYQAVFIQGNAEFWNFDNIAEFTEKELEENEDYLYADFKVKNKYYTDLGVMTLLDLDIEELMYLDMDQCAYISTAATVQANSLLSLRVDYAFKETRTEEIGENSTVKISIPENCEYMNDSLTVDGIKAEKVYVNDGSIQVPVTNKEGIIRFTIKPVRVGDFRSDAKIVFSVNGKNYTENIGSMVMGVPFISLHCPEVTTKKEMNVYGSAVPGETIAIYDGDVRVGTATSDRAGKWSADITLNGELDKTNHKIMAKLFAGTEEEVCTETKLVYYDTDHVEITQFMMYYNNHRDTKLDLLEYMKGERPAVAFNPAYPFTFVVKLSDSSKIKTVRIVSTKANGSDQMRATYNPDTDTWVASGHFPEHEVPGNLSVQFSQIDTNPVSMDVEDHCLTDEEFEAMPDSIKNAKAEITQNSVTTKGDAKFSGTIALDDKMKTVLGFDIQSSRLEVEEEEDDKVVIVGKPDEIRTITNDVTIAPRDPGELTKDGFVKIETADGEYDYYMKMEVTEDGQLKQEMYKYPAGGGNALTAGVDHMVVDITCHAEEIMQGFPEGTDVPNPLTPILDTVDLAYDVYANDKKLDYARSVVENADISEGERARKLAQLEKVDEMQFYYTLGRVAVYTFATVVAVTGGSVPFLLGLVTGGIIAGVNSYIESIMDQLILMILDLEIGWLVDPSGFVYEAVPSNRLEGVKATIYYKDENGKVVLWNAEEYSQKNPLYTDVGGTYAWDVPEGEWQVKYELDGYEVGYSEWLPVPPIQLNVNEGMISLKVPEVELTELYESCAVITFDKYMKVSAMTADSVLRVVDGDGNEIEATVETLDEENSPEGEALARSYKLVFKNEIASGDYTLKVSKEAESYAGIQLKETFKETLSVKSSIKNMDIEIPEEILTGNTLTIPVTLTKDGNTVYTIKAETSMSDIAEVVSVSATDIILKAKLPGTVTLYVEVEGTTLRKEVELQIGSSIKDIDTTDINTLYVEKIAAQVYTGKEVKPSVKVIDNGVMLKEGTDYIVTYADNNKPGIATITIEGTGNYAGNRIETFNIELAAPSLSVIQNTATGVKLTWKKVSGADGYIIYRKVGTATKWTKWKTVGDVASVTNTGLTSGKKYAYTVSAYNDDMESKYNTTGKSITYLKRPTVTLANAATGSTVKWGKITGATGYIVYRKAGTAKTWTKVTTIKSGSTVSYNDKKANTNGTKYQYYVKASKGTVYSANAATVTTYRLTRPALTTYKNVATRKISLKWTKNIKATGYEIRYQTGTKTNTVKVKGYKNISKTLTKLTKNKTYKVSVRSYKTVSGKTYYSAWSTVKSVKVKK